MRTDAGDLVLDNLNDAVKMWYETSYSYIKRQATYDTGRWVTIREDHAPLVGSVDWAPIVRAFERRSGNGTRLPRG